MILLDTNVLSELMRPRPDDHVVGWVARQQTADLFTSSITQAEILHGIQVLPSGRRREALQAAADAMFDRDFHGRILAFGSDAARAYATIAASRRRAGRPISHFDAQIAAIARAAGASLATRNVADYDRCGVSVINPWRIPAGGDDPAGT
jgi:predicted nucleic acid-binding protein